MPLVLAHSFDEHTRAEIEAHLEQVRSRRMLAAVEYHTGINAKLTYESDKIQKRVAQKYEMLLKEIGQLDRIVEKVENRLAEIEHLKNELGLLTDLRTEHAIDEETENE